MERPLEQIYQSLQKLIGLHRQLLDAVRSEREALVEADLKAIEKLTALKHSLLESIRQAESDRLKQTGELAVLWKKSYRELTLSNVIQETQGREPNAAEQLRSAYNVLTLLIQRISEQNLDNRALIEKSLEHIHEMKRNAIGEAAGKTNTYTQTGQKANGRATSRLISREA